MKTRILRVIFKSKSRSSEQDFLIKTSTGLERYGKTLLDKSTSLTCLSTDQLDPLSVTQI